MTIDKWYQQLLSYHFISNIYVLNVFYISKAYILYGHYLS